LNENENAPEADKSAVEPGDLPTGSPGADSDSTESRRTFFSTCGNLAMVGGLAASYGTLGVCAIRFLTPNPNDENLDWQFVATLESLEGQNSYEYIASSGVKIVIARAAEAAESGFLALSSVCPHLGCQVFWEAAKDRFFCPCHNGTFDSGGKATGGPPADANQSLTQYPTKIHNEALYVYAPLETVTKLREGA
jgi:cytochrome b6-f complex iron-sulfur subunit